MKCWGDITFEGNCNEIIWRRIWQSLKAVLEHHAFYSFCGFELQEQYVEHAFYMIEKKLNSYNKSLAKKNSTPICKARISCIMWAPSSTVRISKQAECRHAIWHILRSSSIPYPEKIKAFVMQELSKTAVKGGAIFVRDLRQDAEPRREDRSQNNAPDHGFLWPRYFSRNRCKKFLHVSILSGEFPNTVLALLVMAASTHDSLLLPERLSWLPQLQNVASHRSASPIPEKRETIISFSLAGRKCSLQLALTSRRNLRLSAYGMIDIDDRAMQQSRIQSSHLLLRLLRFSRKQELVNIFNNNIHAESMRNTRKETSDMRVMF